MAKNMTKWIGQKVSAVTPLSMKACEYDRENMCCALQTCERFLQAAALLPKREFLGWQINIREDGRHSVTAFSSRDAGMTPADCAWIFEPCAEAKGEPEQLPGGLREDCRRVYALRVTEESAKSFDICNGNTYETFLRDREDFLKKPFPDLWKELKKANAVIRILAKAKQDGAQGMVLIGLQDKIPLRLQSALSLTFPKLAAVPLNTAQEAGAGIDRLPSKRLVSMMADLLHVLMIERPAPDCSDDCLPAMENDPSENDSAENNFAESDSSGCGPSGSGPSKSSSADEILIEELDLGVRAYNCLKRAGINTVGQLRTMTDDDFAHVRNLGKRSTQEIKEKLANMTVLPAFAPLTASNCREMLEELIGLGPVKTQVKKIAAFAKMKRELVAQNSTQVPMALNMEFTGNPGTAKTTVARILAGIFHDMGLLSGSLVVEVGRADLVARYEGQTADQVKSVFRRAKGKILFIDEAYSLVENCAGEFGDEAINTIVQEMENHREDTIVIFAGYPDQMEAFFARNPGLRSRVPFHIHFDDYSVGEMVQIVELEAKKRGFSIRPEAEAQIGSVCKAAADSPDSGNGRFCRNLVENAILNYAARVYGDLNESRDAAANQDLVLEEQDFSLPEILQKPDKTMTIGFGR